MSRICSGLYLGGHSDAVDVAFLQRQHITGIVSCCSSSDFGSPDDTEIKHIRVDVEDISNEPILAGFDEVYRFILFHLKCAPMTAVLVHCRSGVSRSATIVIAFIMRYKQMDLRNAFLYVIDKRPCICPNIGFVNQLCKFEQKLAEANCFCLSSRSQRDRDLIIASMSNGFKGPDAETSQLDVPTDDGGDEPLHDGNLSAPAFVDPKQTIAEMKSAPAGTSNSVHDGGTEGRHHQGHHYHYDDDDDDRYYHNVLANEQHGSCQKDASHSAESRGCRTFSSPPITRTTGHHNNWIRTTATTIPLENNNEISSTTNSAVETDCGDYWRVTGCTHDDYRTASFVPSSMRIKYNQYLRPPMILHSPYRVPQFIIAHSPPVRHSPLLPTSAPCPSSTPLLNSLNDFEFSGAPLTASSTTPAEINMSRNGGEMTAASVDCQHHDQIQPCRHSKQTPSVCMAKYISWYTAQAKHRPAVPSLAP